MEPRILSEETLRSGAVVRVVEKLVREKTFTFDITDLPGAQRTDLLRSVAASVNWWKRDNPGNEGAYAELRSHLPQDVAQGWREHLVVGGVNGDRDTGRLKNMLVSYVEGARAHAPAWRAMLARA